MSSATYVPKPVRASDLSASRSIQNLCVEHGFNTLNEGLHAIVKANLAPYVPELSYEPSTGNTINWFFNPTSGAHIRKQKAKVAPHVLCIDVREKLSLYFAEREIAVLANYGPKFEKLVNGLKEPSTQAQERFKQVATELLHVSLSPKGTKPEDFYQKLIAKYIISSYYNM